MGQEAHNLFEFEWERDIEGYRLVKADPLQRIEKKHFGTLPNYGEPEFIYELHEKTVIEPVSGKTEKYHPFVENLGIAREFSCLPDSEEMMKFAKKYGLLGQRTPHQISEDIEEWAEQISFFKKIFEAIDQGDSQLALSLFNSSLLKPSVTFSISTEHNKFRRKLSIQPPDLLSAMWIMISKQLTSGLELQECANPECSKWFKRRSNKKCCSTVCRVSYNRIKNKKSLEGAD